MYKFKQLFLITSLVFSGVLNAGSESISKVTANLTALRQCERVIAPNYVLGERFKLDTCIKDNSTEFSAVEREFGAKGDKVNLDHAVGKRSEIIAELSQAYDEAVAYDNAVHVLAKGTIAFLCLNASLAVIGVFLEQVKSGAKS